MKVAVSATVGPSDSSFRSRSREWHSARRSLSEDIAWPPDDAVSFESCHVARIVRSQSVGAKKWCDGFSLNRVASGVKGKGDRSEICMADVVLGADGMTSKGPVPPVPRLAGTVVVTGGATGCDSDRELRERNGARAEQVAKHGLNYPVDFGDISIPLSCTGVGATHRTC